MSALAALVEHPEAYGGVFNIGSDEEVSIAELAALILAETGSSSKIRHVAYGEAYEEGFEDMPRRVPDTSRARNLVGFSPTLRLNEIVRLVVEEHRSTP